MEIRPAAEQDAKLLLNLMKKLDQSKMMLFEPGERKESIEPIKSMIHHLSTQENAMLFVAELDGKLVGYLTVQGGTVKRIKHRAYITIGVDEEYRGRGIATSLFGSLFKWAPNYGISRLELTVIKHNKPAFDLYRKMGFVLEGEKVHSLMIEGKPVNEYYLYKLI
ncbi:GNAT family N-acetyltransferase [Alkalihalophilus lindianensis]|uniref:GNAT family N-acetyltransferase n=1 Tax=Alkalihalophilus lindianensis TaxID=1630542 RepID=A0ABU3XFB2_9BACI|nr:GNAT family N-acetyltransferase [Alkalihalophilus lindianensis]MDV2686584.1 GNAT family N-acetyltransferase [Alkalihalophilus lindianensis]